MLNEIVSNKVNKLSKMRCNNMSGFYKPNKCSSIEVSNSQ